MNLRSHSVRLSAALTLAAIIGVSIPTLDAVAAGHSTYALGKAKSCKTHFAKRTEKHKVNGKDVRYVACVYVASAGTSTTTTAPTRLPATATMALATTIGLGTLLGSVDTYCIYCVTHTAPNGGQETINLVSTGTGQVFGTWTTVATATADTIQWTVATSGTFLLLTLDNTSNPWTGPLTIEVPAIDNIGGVGIRASFSGSSNLAGSTSAVSQITLL